jgi:nitrate reductase gamma subunit
VDVVRFIIGGIIPYVAIAVFIVAMIYRIYVWKRLPSPTMTLFPSPESYGNRSIEVLKETFLFKRLFWGDMDLWFLAMLFHLTLAINFIDHYDRILAFMGMTEGSLFNIPYVTGGPTGIAVLICVAALLIRRLTMKRVAQVTSGSDYFALILILAVVLTGDALRYMSHFDVLQMREYFTGLLAFSYKGLPENNWFLVHYLLALILIIYIPFSKILHLGGIFFTQAVIHKH